MKEKLLKFLHRLPLKLYLLLAAAVIFSFFSNDFGLVDVQKTAIVIAAGIDREEDSFTLTAQIAMPSGDKTSGGTTPVEVHGSGETLSACMAELSARTGRVPKFIFCNLVVLGENAVKENVLSSLDFFLRNEYVSDSCFLATCEGKASELITAKSAIDDSSSLAIQKLFSDAAVRAGRVIPTTLKDFAIGYYGKSKSGRMPLVRATEHEEGKDAGGGSGGSSGSGNSGGGEQKKIFSAERTAIFSEGKMVGVLDENETFAYNLLQGKVFASGVTVETSEGTHAVTVLENGGSASVSTQSVPTADFSITLRVDVHNKETPSSIHEIADSVPSDELCEKTEELLRGYVSSLFEKCQAANCDLFYLRRQLYRNAPKEYEKWQNNLLSALKLSLQISVEKAR